MSKHSPRIQRLRNHLNIIVNRCLPTRSKAQYYGTILRHRTKRPSNQVPSINIYRKISD